MMRWLTCGLWLLLLLQGCTSFTLLQYQSAADGISTDPINDLVHNHSMIFIGGLHRSGTSFLNYLVAANPQVSGFYGTGAPENEGQHLQNVFPPDSRVVFHTLVNDSRVKCGVEKGLFSRARPMQVWGHGKMAHSLFASAQLGHLTESSPLCTQPNRQELWASWSRHWDLERRWLVEKSPTNIIRTRFLQELFGSTRTQFLLTMRHPLTQVSPVFECSYFAHVEEHIQQFVLIWYYWLQMDIVHLAKCTIFRYEDMAVDPFSFARDLYEALGLPPHSPNLLESERAKVPRRKPLNFHGTAKPDEGISFQPNPKAWISNWRAICNECPSILLSLSKFEKYLKPFGYSLHEPFILPTNLSGVFPDVNIARSTRNNPNNALRWEPSHASPEDSRMQAMLQARLSHCFDWTDFESSASSCSSGLLSFVILFICALLWSSSMF